MKIFRGVIWDIDGTLLDSNDAHAKAYEEALDLEGFPRPYEQIRSKIGMGADQLLPSLVGHGEDSPEGKRINKTKKKIFESKYFETLRPFPKAFDLVERLHRQGMKLAVGTSASKKDCNRFLSLLGIDHFIDQIVSADDIEQSKPDPEVVSKCVARLKLLPSEVIMIGDTPYDMEAAAKANVSSIAFRCGGWSDQDLKISTAIYDGPEHLFSALDESVLRRPTDQPGHAG